MFFVREKFSIDCKENELYTVNRHLGALKEKPTPHRILTPQEAVNGL